MYEFNASSKSNFVNYRTGVSIVSHFLAPWEPVRFTTMEKHEKRITITDLAQKIGFSPATVSRALRNDPAINKKTRKMIAMAAAEMGYDLHVSVIKKADEQFSDPQPAKGGPVTIYDIAKVLGLSVATVSRALSNGPKVKANTREKVFRVAEGMGYTLNNAARTLVTKRKEADNVSKAVTIYDIAKTLKLSPSTVSRYLRNTDGSTSSKYQLVQKTAKKLGYTIDTNASELRKPKTETVAVVLPNFNARTNLVLQGIEHVARQKGISLLISNCRSFELNMKRQADTILSLADGIIVLPDGNTAIQSVILNKTGGFKPGVCLGTFKNGVSFERVTINPYQLVYDLTRNLLSKGKRSLCYIEFLNDTILYLEHIQAFKKAHRDIGLVANRRLVFHIDSSDGYLNTVIDRLLAEPEIPDGIILINGHLDEISASRLRNAGIDLETALLVGEMECDTSSDDLYENAHGLTYDFYDLGQKGILKLMSKIDNPSKPGKDTAFAKHLQFKDRPVMKP